MESAFHIVTVVWGESYTNLLVRMAIPSLLSPGNLPSLKNKEKSVYKIFTFPEDAERIKSSPAYSRIRALIPTEIHLMSDLDPALFLGFDPDDRYKAITKCHTKVINDALSEGIGTLIIHPDLVWADGAFARVQGIADSGKTAVLAAGIRLAKETALPLLLDDFFSEKDGTLTILPRELVKIAMGNLHPITKSDFWDSERACLWPDSLFWPVQNEGLISRIFYLYPILTHPRKPVLPTTSVDAKDYMLQAHPDFDEIYIVNDSDELVFFGLDSSSHGSHWIPDKMNRFNILRMTLWALENASTHHHRFLGQKIRIHCQEISSKWDSAEKHSDTVINTILLMLKFGRLIEIFILINLLLRKIYINMRSLLQAILNLPFKFLLYISEKLTARRVYRAGILFLEQYYKYSKKGDMDCNRQYNIAFLLKNKDYYKYSEMILLKLKNIGYSPRLVNYQLGEINYWFKKDIDKAREYFLSVAADIPKEIINANKYIDLCHKDSYN